MEMRETPAKGGATPEKRGEPTKIHTELEWLPETKFKDGIKKTIQWYLDHRTWWETILSGEYQDYYEKMYGNRGEA